MELRMAPNLTGQLDPSALSQFVGYTCSPHDSQTATGIPLAVSTHNLGLARVSPTVVTGTNALFGNTYSITVPLAKVAINVTTAPTIVTHSWIALFDMGGNCQAVTADGGVTAWGTGYQTFNWVGPFNPTVGGLYYVDVIIVNTGTVPKLSGITALAAEVTGAQAANGTTPYSWATNSGTVGTTPPVVGTSTLSYASNTAATVGLFAGLL